VSQRSGIQATVDHYIDAFNHYDAALLTQTLDPTNAPFRRYIHTRFETFHMAQHGRLTLAPLTIADLTPQPAGYVATQLVSPNGEATDWLFREVDGQWRITEPTVAQIGQPQKVVQGTITFITYPWADPVNAAIIALFAQAQHQVHTLLGQVPTRPLTVELCPIYGLHPFDNPFYVAYYTPGSTPKTPDHIQIFTPHTYMFGYYDQAMGWEPALQRILAHEYTHMVHTRCFANAGYETTWMPEGLAEYVADAPAAIDIRVALTRTTVIPIIDTTTAVYKQDLMHMVTLDQDRDLAYDYAHALVQYIMQHFGGLPAFWHLAEAYDQSQNLDLALQQALGITYHAFDLAWRIWLKQRA
jgi:hypothetical protein